MGMIAAKAIMLPSDGLTCSAYDGRAVRGFPSISFCWWFVAWCKSIFAVVGKCSLGGLRSERPSGRDWTCSHGASGRNLSSRWRRGGGKVRELTVAGPDGAASIKGDD